MNFDTEFQVCRNIFLTFHILQDFQPVHKRNDMYFPLFLPLCGISKENKGIFYLVVACYFIKKSGRVPLCFSCRVGIDVHYGTDIRVS